MNVSGSSIAAYYAGNAALALDRHAAHQQSQAAQQRLQHANRPAGLSEQVLEGELLNKEQQPKAQFQSGASGGESGERQQQRFDESSRFNANASSANPAIRAYQTTAQLDGLSRGGPVHQLDIYV